MKREQLGQQMDFLADMDNYDKRNWGHDSYSVSLNIGSQVLASL